jgi:transcription-repair coupling factor (superfamily II helicase)
MSLSGVRDMSIIDTPPLARTPIKVQVGEWNEDTVSAAIRHEMARGGQVYYVSNRVKTIDDAVARVTAAAPEARVAVAHGQMSVNELEHVMEGFAANEYDVLVATTIIESGIDNPHSNTLIIEDSQRLGLAQLYQLKGRVGRSHAQAFAYFLFPRADALTPEAMERLMAIDEFQNLGSGMHIAMRDLEIRGAGTLLGGEQSGMLTSVGFDLYAQMIAEAVATVRSEKPEAHPEVRIDLPIHFYLPEEYVPAADERVLCYRRIAAADVAEELEKIQSDLQQTYGVMPEPAVNLIDRAKLKLLAAEQGITNISIQRGRVVLEPLELNAEQKQWASEHKATYMVKSLKLLATPSPDAPLARAVLQILQALSST